MKGSYLYLVQILLPVRNNAGDPFPANVLKGISSQLAKQFGGVTAYSRAPAKGQWLDNDHMERDDVISVEVMVPDLDRDWWDLFRKSLESELDQKELVVRAHLIERL